MKKSFTNFLTVIFLFGCFITLGQNQLQLKADKITKNAVSLSENSEELQQERELQEKMRAIAKRLYPNRFQPIAEQNRKNLQRGNKSSLSLAKTFDSEPSDTKKQEQVSYDFADKDQVTHFRDDPNARDQFEVLRTKNPATGLVPKDIRRLELNFTRDQLKKRGRVKAPGDILTPWTNRGPHNVGGRTRALAVDLTDENIVLAGGVSGGMWRSTDQGASWTKTTGSNELQSVTCIAQDPTNTSVWYYGTGEWRGNSAGDPGAFYFGDGIYKSTDGGSSWTLLSVTSTDTPEFWDQDFDFNHEMVVNPVNGNLLVATTGGIYQSTDGGDSFTKTLPGGADSRWSELAITSTGLAYAVIDDQGVFSSSDGVTWTDITPTNGYSLNSSERKELAIAPSNENIMYLLGQDGNAASAHSIWKFDESTDVWENRSSNVPQLGGQTGNFSTQGGYDQLITVKSDDENFVIIGGTNLFASTDGFSSTANTTWIGGYTSANNSFALYPNHHPDQHSFAFLSNNQAISGNDGGVQITSDITSGNVVWTPLNNGYLTTQVYAISVGPGDQIMAGFQDNSTWLTVSPDSDTDWTDQFGGDGAYNAFNSDGSVRYMSSQNGNVYRVNYGSADDITADGFTYFTPDGFESSLFIAPFYLDPVNDDIFYMGGHNFLYVNTQASTGSSTSGWKTIDLGSNGVVSEFGTTLDNKVYVGTSAGEVFVVETPGDTAEVINITGSNFPSGYVSGVAVNKLNSNEVIVTFSNYSIPSVFYTTNGGSTWEDISGSLEENTDGSGSGPSVRTASILGNGDIYFVGTSTGLFATTSISGSSTTWIQENSSGIGEVVVDHLVGRNADGQLAAGTHGNGVFSAKYEVAGLPENDLAITDITSPDDLVNATHPISISIANLGTLSQSGFDISYSVNGTLVETTTFSETINAGESADFTFPTEFDFSALGEYEISVEHALASDEISGNNSSSKMVVNAEFVGTYVVTQVEATTSGVSSFYGNGFLFGLSAIVLADIEYIDANTRSVNAAYLPQFGSSIRPYTFTLSNGEVIFDDEQLSGLSCGGVNILLGTADSPGNYTEGDDASFTATLKENILAACDVGSSDVSFEFVKQVTDDIAVTRIISPESENFVGEYGIVAEIRNVGINAQSDFDLSFQINGDLIATQAFDGELLSGETFILEFNESFNFEEGTNELIVSVSSNADTNAANDQVSKTINTSILDGFTGPYELVQLDTVPADVGVVGAFGNGFMFGPEMRSEIYLEDLGNGQRKFNAAYIGLGFKEMTFTISGTETVFDNEQDMRLSCGGPGIFLGTADTQGAIDLSDEDTFYLNIKDNILSGCGLGSYDVAFILNKLPEVHDLSVIDVTNPPSIFYGQEMQVGVFVYNYGNVPENEYEVSYSVNGVEVASQAFNTEIFQGQGRQVLFDVPFDFSVGETYEISATVSLVGDEFPENNSYTESVESYEAIADFPYTESFDGSAEFPLGYDDSFGQWLIGNGSTSPDQTGPLGDNTLGSGNYAYTHMDGNFNESRRMLTREINLAEYDAPQLEFFYHMYGTSTATLRVNVINEFGGRLEALRLEGEQQESANSNYKGARVNLSQFTDQIIRLEFWVQNPPRGVPATIAIDDIEVSDAAIHDLAISGIVEPKGTASGERVVSVEITNIGASAEAEFPVTYYVNDVLIGEEVFEEVILAGQTLIYTFNTTYDFDENAEVVLRAEVTLPSDEFGDNNTIESTLNIAPIPFTGSYTLQQAAPTEAGVSASFNNGYVFSSNGVNQVNLTYVDDTTRSFKATYLESQGIANLDYFLIIKNGEVYFNNNQDDRFGCGGLGTADSLGFYSDDLLFNFYLREGVIDACGYGTVDVEFYLNKESSNVEYDLALTSINFADVIPSAQHYVNFTIENKGLFTQTNFDVAFAVNGVFQDTITIFNQIDPDRNLTISFQELYDFNTIDAFDVSVEIIRANDSDPSNNQITKQIQTSGFIINATPIGNSEIGIEWSNLISSTGYVLERSENDSEFADIAALSADEKFYIDQNTDPSSFYNYRLRASLDGGGETVSNIVGANASIDGNYMFEKVLGDITGVDLPNWSYGNAWGDLDDDGDLDMIVSNVPNFDGSLFLADQPYVYLNNGDGSFEKATDISLVTGGISSRSTAIIDFNNDGLKDVYIPQLNSSSGDRDDRLFKNNGNLNFSKVNVPEFTKNYSNEQSVWGDMDNDGDLDLFLAGQFFQGRQDFIFMNNGDGTMESITSGVIYETLYNSGMNAWTASWVDYDNDGDQDLYVPDDSNPGNEKFFRNMGNGAFELIEGNAITQDALRVRGAHWADFDQDGWLDLMAIPVNSSPVFYFNDGDESFTKVESSEAFGVTLNIHRISTVGDINNNGKLDFMLASNGYFVFESNNDRTFTQLENVIPPLEGGVFAGMSLADMDGDGDLDLFRGTGGSGYAHNLLYRNKGNGNNWLHMELNGEFSNADGIGARIALFDGPDTQYRTINPISGLISHNSLTAEFGLGMTSVVDSIRITWPSGTIKMLYDVNANQLIEVNDSNAPTDVGLSNASVPEGLASGAAVGASFSVDLDTGDGHNYEIVTDGNIVGGANIYSKREGSFLRSKYSKANQWSSYSFDERNARFADDGDNFTIVDGTIRAATTFDFEGQSTYSVRLRSIDSFGNTFEKILNIEILDVNEDIENSSPTDIALSALSINENESVNTVLGSLSSVDLDEENTHTYSLVAGDANLFSIDGDQIVIAKSFNFEQKSEYSFTIRTIDDGGLSFDKDFTVSVKNVNESPLKLTLSNKSVEEELVAGSLVGVLTTTDTDLNDSHTYSITGSDAEFFQIVGNELLTTQKLNFEDRSGFDITIQSADAGGLNIQKDYTIDVLNVNDAPRELSLSASSINEEVVKGIKIANLSVLDDDEGDQHKYTLSGPDASSFQIVLNELRTGKKFNFEEKSSYNISITVTDSDGASLTEQRTISVNDINDKPSGLLLSNNEVVEGQNAGFTIGSLTTIDEDVSDSHAYTLVSGAGDSGNANFSLTNGVLKSSAEFDFETQASYSVRIRTTDQGGGILEQQFDISVIDVDETNPNSAPTAISISNSDIQENSTIGSVIGTLSSTDVDNGDSHNYIIVSGNTSLFSIDGDILETKSALDFEKTSSYNLTIRTTDVGGLVFDEQFTIAVTDQNEAPINLSLSNNTIEESASIGTVIGDLSSEDEDNGDSHGYTLSGADAASFDISNGQLVTLSELDFETKGSYVFTVTSTDAGSLTFDKEVTIEIGDVNEAPSDLTITSSSIAEELSSGSVVGSFAITDEDAGDSHTYSLAGADASSFKVVIDKLRTNAKFNFEDKSSYTIDVTATDANGLSTQSTITINVEDQNDVPTSLSIDGNTIDENEASGSIVAILTVEDEDVSDVHTYSLSGIDAASFTENDGELRTNSAFNFESKSAFNITITATDSGGESISENFAISVNDVNEAPESVTLSNNVIDESLAVGSVVGNIDFDDFDTGDSHTITLSGSDADKFSVDNGNLINSEAFNFESQSTLALTVTVEDQGGLSASENFSISLNDVNEAPTAIALSGAEINEGEAAGTTIGSVSVEDEDANDTHTYSLTGNDATSFEIANGILTNKEVLDFATQETYSITIEATDAGGLAFSEEFTITVKRVLGLEDNDLKIYPNPSKGVFTIELNSEWKGASWTLYDLTGKVQKAVQVIEKSDLLIEVNASSLSNGEYILKIVNGANQMTRKIIIKK